MQGYSTGHSKQKKHVCTRPIPYGFRDELLSLYSSKIVDKEEILHIVSNTGIYCSSDKVGTIYLIQYILKNSTVNISALCNSCQDMACCSSVQCTQIALPQKLFGIGHAYISISLPRMTNNVASQNTDLSSWDIPYKRHYMSQIPHSLVYHAHLLPEMSTQKMGHKTYMVFSFLCKQFNIHYSTSWMDCSPFQLWATSSSR
jgi:hypothetical protein